MKLTKGRIEKLFLKQNQTRKRNKNKVNINNTITFKNRKKQINLRKQTMKNVSTITI